MKKLLIPAVIIVAVFLMYEQSKPSPNLYLSLGFILVFMFLLYKLNTRIPHKRDNNNDGEDV